MSYILSLSPDAEQQLNALPEPLRQFTNSSLQQLAESPSSYRSKTAVTSGQLAEFHFDRGGVSLWVMVTFLYGQDEQTLHVEDIDIEFAP